MSPDQQNPYSQPPQQPPAQNPYTQQPQQHANGQYQVVPPLPVLNNGGHSGHNPYEFIVAPNTRQPKRFSFGSGSSLYIRIGVVLGGITILIIIAAIVASALAPKSSSPGLTAIAQRQEEIVRVSAAASTAVTDQDTKNFVANVNASVGSGQQQVISYLAEHGTKLDSKVLALDYSAQTDTLLADAASANNYDTAAVQNLTEQLQTYESLLRTTFKSSSNKQTKQLMQDCYTSADKLLVQAKALSASD